MNKDSRIFVAGANGMVGSALVRALGAAGFENLLTPSRSELDLMDHGAVAAFFEDQRPEFVFLAAAKVGGIHANSTYPADFLLDNLKIQNNVIEMAYKSGVSKLLFLGSSCIYPKLAPQPLKEEYLLSDYLEPTNEAYAIAKIAGIKLCDAFHEQHGFNSLSLMPTNLYGPNDNFDLQSSHVLPALIRKFHEAKVSGDDTVTLWGSGKPLREFMHVDDLASACLFLMEVETNFRLVNVGSGEEISILNLARLIADVVGFDGKLGFDSGKPDGTPRKLMDSGRLHSLGWRPSVGLQEGIETTYEWFQTHHAG